MFHLANNLGQRHFEMASVKKVSEKERDKLGGHSRNTISIGMYWWMAVKHELDLDSHAHIGLVTLTFFVRSLYEVAQPTLRQELSRITMTEEQCQLIWDKLEQSGYNEEAASDLWRQLAASGMWQPTTKKVILQHQWHQSARKGIWWHLSGY